MKTLLLCLLLAAISQPSVPEPETFRQELIMKYPVLATEKRPEAVLKEIRDAKTRVREMIALQDDLPVADDMLANAELLATADRLTERLPGTFEHILHAASLYDIMREGTVRPVFQDSRKPILTRFQSRLHNRPDCRIGNKPR